MGVSTVETNRDRDRDCPSCRDQFLKPVETFSTIKIDFYFISVEIFKIETFQLRLCRVKIFVEIVETHRDCQNLLRCSRDLSRNLNEKIQNPCTSWSRSRQTVKKRQNFQISTNFSILIETFWSGHWCRDKIKKSQSRPRFLDCQDALFDAVKIFLTVETHSLTTSRSRLSIETRSRQIKTPMLTEYARVRIYAYQ
jgi:hypothetical protein